MRDTFQGSTRLNPYGLAIWWDSRAGSNLALLVVLGKGGSRGEFWEKSNKWTYTVAVSNCLSTRENQPLAYLCFRWVAARALQFLALWHGFCGRLKADPGVGPVAEGLLAGGAAAA